MENWWAAKRREATAGALPVLVLGALATVTPTIYRATRIYPIQTFARRGIDRYWSLSLDAGSVVASWSTCWRRPQLKGLGCGCRRWTFNSSNCKSSSFRSVQWLTYISNILEIFYDFHSTIELNCCSWQDIVYRESFASRIERYL